MAVDVPVIRPNGRGVQNASANAVTMKKYDSSNPETTEYAVKASPTTLVILRRAKGTTAGGVTLVTPYTHNGLALADRTWPIATSGRPLWRVAGLQSKYYANADGDMIFRWSGTDDEAEISATRVTD